MTVRGIQAILVSTALTSCGTTIDSNHNQLKASIDNSEWRNPAIAFVNLTNGNYEVRPPERVWVNPKQRFGRSPFWTRVRRGVLTDKDLATLQNVSEAAAKTGLFNPACDADPSTMEYIIVSTGGDRTLALRWDNRQLRQSKERACWTEEANHLFSVNYEIFEQIRASESD